MLTSIPEYSVAIRTLGKAGEKYQRLLNSLMAQTLPPKKIVVYLAEGYPIPPETCGKEQYVYVPKGMVKQRALPFVEITTEWILFADDDIELPPNGVERMFELLQEYHADVIVPDFFVHTDLNFKVKLGMALILSAIPDFTSKSNGYRVNKLGSYNYNPYKSAAVGISSTNAGCGFLARKHDYLKVHFEKELWLDEVPYSAADDMVMYYKMHLYGLKILTQYHSGWKHLDAQTSISPLATKQRIYSGERNLTIFRGLYVIPQLSARQRFRTKILLCYKTIVEYIYWAAKDLITCQFCHVPAKYSGQKDGIKRLKELFTTSYPIIP